MMCGLLLLSSSLGLQQAALLTIWAWQAILNFREQNKSCSNDQSKGLINNEVARPWKADRY